MFELFDEEKKGRLTLAQCCKVGMQSLFQTTTTGSSRYCNPPSFLAPRLHQAYLSLLKREASGETLIAEMVALGYKEDEVKETITLEIFITLFENHKAEPKERESINFQAFSHGRFVTSSRHL